MASGLQQFKNHLSYSQIADGMNAACENARRLVEDARILFDSQRYPSVVSFAILAIEDSGKTTILREMATARDGKALKAAWKSYRSHTKKNVAWILPDLVNNGARKLEEFDQISNPRGDHLELLDNLKQIGFYRDCLGKAHWSVPSEVIDEGTAILTQRHSLNQAARAAKPERWSGNTRNWTPAAVVTLNPERKEALVAMKVAA
jgi:AbiV family abortive infection protein